VAAHAHHSEPAPEDRIKLRESSGMLVIIGIVAAAAGVAMLFLGKHETQRILFSYLMAWVFFTTMALGALFAVVVHHASRAGWNVTIRRTSENIAATLPILWLLSIPLLISIVNQKGTIYRWAIPPNSPELVNHEEGAQTADEKLPRAKNFLPLPRPPTPSAPPNLLMGPSLRMASSGSAMARSPGTATPFSSFEFSFTSRPCRASPYGSGGHPSGRITPATKT